MIGFPTCHWREGGPAQGYRCRSPISGPNTPVDALACRACNVQDHYDTPQASGIKCELPPAKRADGGILPTKVVRLSLREKYFQGSILAHQGRLLMAVRYGWVGATLRLVELGDDLQPRDVWDVDVRHRNAVAGVEDPRLFTFRGRLHVSCNVLDHVQGELRSTILVARLTEDGRQVEDVWSPDYDQQTIIEKNWAFFEHDAQLYCVYTIDPHLVLRMDALYATPLGLCSSMLLNWDYGHFRGGAPPVRVGDEYYHWFHGQRITRDEGGKLVYYAGGLYTFAAQPPFEVRRFSPLPVLLPREGEFAPWPGVQVVFPCGAILHEGRWLVSYGYNDRECRIAEFDPEDVEAMLGPVEKKARRKRLKACT